MLENVMLEKIINLVRDIIGNEQLDLRKDSLFKEELGMNSFEKVQLIGAVEEEFGVCISNSRARKIRDVNGLLEVIKGVTF